MVMKGILVLVLIVISVHARRGYNITLPKVANVTGLTSYGTCSYNGQTGYCEDTSLCIGTSLPQDLCPGPNNIQCCVNSPTCSYNGQNGVCIDVGACTGTSLPEDLCPGGDNIECCVSGGGGSSGNSGDSSSGTSGGSPSRQAAIARAMQWVDVNLMYCEAIYEGYDSACGDTCNRQENPAWDPYRSDCSGFVSWSWGLGAPGLVTGEFAPYDTSVSNTIDCTDLQPGDALNSTPDQHIMLFQSWDVVGQSAWILEEPTCGEGAERTLMSVQCQGNQIYIPNWDPVQYYTIRYDKFAGSSGTSGNGGSNGSSGNGGSSGTGSSSGNNGSSSGGSNGGSNGSSNGGSNGGSNGSSNGGSSNSGGSNGSSNGLFKLKMN